MTVRRRSDLVPCLAELVEAGAAVAGVTRYADAQTGRTTLAFGLHHAVGDGVHAQAYAGAVVAALSTGAQPVDVSATPVPPSAEQHLGLAPAPADPTVLTDIAGLRDVIPMRRTWAADFRIDRARVARLREIARRHQLTTKQLITGIVLATHLQARGEPVPASLGVGTSLDARGWETPRLDPRAVTNFAVSVELRVAAPGGADPVTLGRGFADGVRAAVAGIDASSYFGTGRNFAGGRTEVVDLVVSFLEQPPDPEVGHLKITGWRLDLTKMFCGFPLYVVHDLRGDYSVGVLSADGEQLFASPSAFGAAVDATVEAVLAAG